MIQYDIRPVKLAFDAYYVLVAYSGKGVCAVLFGESEWELADELHNLCDVDCNRTNDESPIDKVVNGIEYGRDLHHIPIDMKFGTPFQQLVWQAVRKIPAGSTTTYSDLAAKLSMPRAARAVASAIAANPIALLIPCHRVLPKVGGIGNYRWSTDLKYLFLSQEQRIRLDIDSQELHDFVGDIPTRTECEVLPADDPKQTKLGFKITEKLGILIHTPGHRSSDDVTIAPLNPVEY